MSAYSDWRCGALSDEEYRQAAMYEARREEYYDTISEYDYEEGDEEE